jgi:hypothetical protein
MHSVRRAALRREFVELRAGLDVRKTSPLAAEEKCFYLTSPFIEPDGIVVVGHGDAVPRWRNLAPDRPRNGNRLRFAASVLGMKLSKEAHQYNE